MSSSKDVRGGVSEKCFLDVNGNRQGMFLQGRNPRIPVWPYLHGGLPESFLQERRPTPLEDHFTVASWEQRGAGLSTAPHRQSTAHSPIFEELERAGSILREDVLMAVARLAES